MLVKKLNQGDFSIRTDTAKSATTYQLFYQLATGQHNDMTMLNEGHNSVKMLELKNIMNEQ